MINFGYNHRKPGREWTQRTYLGVDAVHQLNGCLDLAIQNGVAYLNSLPYAVDIKGLALVEVRLLSKLLGGARVAFGDEVVHNDIVDVAVSDAR